MSKWINWKGTHEEVELISLRSQSDEVGVREPRVTEARGSDLCSSRIGGRSKVEPMINTSAVQSAAGTSRTNGTAEVLAEKPVRMTLSNVLGEICVNAFICTEPYANHTQTSQKADGGMAERLTVTDTSNGGVSGASQAAIFEASSDLDQDLDVVSGLHRVVSISRVL